MGARFSPPVQSGPGAHPASYTMGTGSFPWVKRQGRGINHPPPSRPEVKEGVELYLYYPLWAFVACSRLDYLIFFFQADFWCHVMNGRVFSKMCTFVGNYGVQLFGETDDGYGTLK